MKPVAFTFVLLTNCCAWSQNCAGYYYLQKNKTIEMVVKNEMGNEIGSVVYFISNLGHDGNAVTSAVNSEMFDKNGKSISKAANYMRCENGVMLMDMKILIPSAQQEQMGDMSAIGTVSYLQYPPAMREGDALNDASFATDFVSGSGVKGSISITITNRRVGATESVTTPAGTWDCLKITYHSKMIFKVDFGIPVSTDVTEWYASGFGIVKTESPRGTTELTSIK